MMKVRSKALWAYLVQNGVLDKDEATIARVKKLYRKEYKQKWKKERRLKKFELRPCFTLKEYTAIQVAAKRAGLKPTTFAREILLATAANTEPIPNKPILFKALQFVTIAAISLSKAGTAIHILESIETAEKLLLQYLFHNDSQNINPPKQFI